MSGHAESMKSGKMENVSVMMALLSLQEFVELALITLLTLVVNVSAKLDINGMKRSLLVT